MASLVISPYPEVIQNPTKRCFIMIKDAPIIQEIPRNWVALCKEPDRDQIYTYYVTHIMNKFSDMSKVYIHNRIYVYNYVIASLSEILKHNLNAGKIIKHLLCIWLTYFIFSLLHHFDLIKIHGTWHFIITDLRRKVWNFFTKVWCFKVHGRKRLWKKRGKPLGKVQ